MGVIDCLLGGREVKKGSTYTALDLPSPSGGGLGGGAASFAGVGCS